MGVLTAELTVRWLAPQGAVLKSRGLFVESTAPAYRLQPGHRGYLGNRVEYMTTVRVNALGVRGAEIDPGDPRPRLVFLGDSFVFGYGIEENESVPVRLERELERRGLRAQVINAGTPGYGTRQQSAWLRAFGLALRPQMVILGIYLENDLEDNGREDAWLVSQRALVGDRSHPAFNPLFDWLYRHSHLYGLLRKLAMRWPERPGPDGERVDVSHALRQLRPVDDAQRRRELGRTEAALDELLHETRQHGVELLAVLIPQDLQVEPARAGRAPGRAPPANCDRPRRHERTLEPTPRRARHPVCGSHADLAAGGDRRPRDVSAYRRSLEPTRGGGGGGGPRACAHARARRGRGRPRSRSGRRAHRRLLLQRSP